MGFVLLDITFRVERAFKVRVPDAWTEGLVGIAWGKAGNDATLAEYHAYILELCRVQNVPPPTESWPILVGVIVDATGLNPDRITPNSKLIRDIAPSG